MPTIGTQIHHDLYIYSSGDTSVSSGDGRYSRATTDGSEIVYEMPTHEYDYPAIPANIDDSCYDYASYDYSIEESGVYTEGIGMLPQERNEASYVNIPNRSWNGNETGLYENGHVRNHQTPPTYMNVTDSDDEVVSNAGYLVVRPDTPPVMTSCSDEGTIVTTKCVAYNSSEQLDDAGSLQYYY